METFAIQLVSRLNTIASDHVMPWIPPTCGGANTGGEGSGWPVFAIPTPQRITVLRSLIWAKKQQDPPLTGTTSNAVRQPHSCWVANAFKRQASVKLPQSCCNPPVGWITQHDGGIRAPLSPNLRLRIHHITCCLMGRPHISMLAQPCERFHWNVGLWSVQCPVTKRLHGIRTLSQTPKMSTMLFPIRSVMIRTPNSLETLDTNLCRELEELQKLEGEVDELERGQAQLAEVLEGMMGGTAQKPDQGSIQQTSSKLAKVCLFVCLFGGHPIP